MKTAEEARRGDGPRRWRCSEEWRAAPTCPTSRGRIGGEEGHNQSRVEGFGVALTGGGGRRRGLDEIRCGGREEGTVGVQCRRHHAKEGEGEASARSRHTEEDGMGGLVGSGAGRGARPAGAGGGRPGVAARVRAGDEGGVRLGWLRLGRCHGPGQEQQCRLLI
jgi:hypothetical protein